MRQVDAARSAVPEETSDGAPERSFDIAACERTAGEVRAAAAEIRGAVVEIRGALSELPDGAAWAGLMDRLFWRGLGLIASGFALLLAYRVLRWLESPRRKAADTRRRTPSARDPGDVECACGPDARGAAAGWTLAR